MDLGLGVLNHELSVPVVYVHQCKGFLVKLVKETLLAVAVVLKSLVVVQVVVSEVGEDTSGKLEARYPLLVHCVGADFHEAVGTSVADHLVQKAVEFQRSRSGVDGRDYLVSYIVGNGGDKAAPVSQGSKGVVKQGGNGGLSVGSGNSYQPELFGRVAEIVYRDLGLGFPAALYHNVDYEVPFSSFHRSFLFFRDVFAHYVLCSSLYRVPDILASVCNRSLYCNEKRSPGTFPGVGCYALDVVVVGQGEHGGVWGELFSSLEFPDDPDAFQKLT